MPTVTAHVSSPRTRRGVIGQLNREWAQLQGAVDAPWLASLTVQLGDDRSGSVDDVLRVIATGAPSDIDRTLHALLGYMAAGDTTAGRVVLQAMLPKCVRLARSARKHGVDGAEGAVLAAMWDTICHYPLQHVTGIPGRLALQTLGAVRGRTHGVEPVRPLSLDALPLESIPDRLPSGPQHEQITLRLMSFLTWAQDSGVLKPSEVQLLARMHLSADADELNLARIAVELGCTAATARQRYSRAVRRLRDATSRAATAA